ncbi:MAG: ABC transporter permease subunit [Gammaproteobacteria bacterium]|nr:ABC transporter permease subunit [Gammaproteobacteria bacterium]
MLAIALRELRSIFRSPLAWTLLAVVQFILAWIFLVQVEEFIQIQPRLAKLATAPGITDLVATPLLNTASLIIMFLIPLMSMRLFSDEYRSGTFSLLLSAPVSMTAIVLGKYLALIIFLSILLVVTAAMPLSLLLGGTLDLGKLSAGLLGLELALAGFAAIGLFFSSITSRPTVAATGTYGLLLFLWIINMASGSGGHSSALFAWISPISHLQNMFSGLVSSADLAYFLLLSISFLALSIRRLDSRRTQG